MCEEKDIDCYNHNDQFYPTLTQCPVLTDSDTVYLDHLDEWLSKIVPIFIALFGLVSNVLLIINISKLQRLRQDVYQILLIALLVGDTCYLLLKLVGISKDYVSTLVTSLDWLYFDVIVN